MKKYATVLFAVSIVTSSAGPFVLSVPARAYAANMNVIQITMLETGAHATGSLIDGTVYVSVSTLLDIMGIVSSFDEKSNRMTLTKIKKQLQIVFRRKLVRIGTSRFDLSAKRWGFRWDGMPLPSPQQYQAFKRTP